LEKKIKNVLNKYDGKKYFMGINHRFLTVSKSYLKEKKLFFYFILYRSGLYKYLKKNKTYGDALVFRKDFNKLDLNHLFNYLNKKRLIVVTSEVSKLKNVAFFNKNTLFVDCPKSNAWDSYAKILNGSLKKAEIIRSKSKSNNNGNDERNVQGNNKGNGKGKSNGKEDILFLISLGPTAKPLVFDLTNKGYMAWDTGHFFDFYLNDLKTNSVNFKRE
ncbi:MAG: DUF1792 domain-containing protein, partial [Nanoarchaeota archaeon]|nr:DUF1792 domain-containing protein [Nanoarchaeota archaeon]